MEKLINHNIAFLCTTSKRKHKQAVGSDVLKRYVKSPIASPFSMIFQEKATYLNVIGFNLSLNEFDAVVFGAML